MMASPHQAPTADDAAASVDLANRREHDDCKAAEATEIEAPAAVRYTHVYVYCSNPPPPPRFLAGVLGSLALSARRHRATGQRTRS